MYSDYQWDAPAWLTRRLGWCLTAAIAAILLVVGSGIAWHETRPEPFRVAAPQIGLGGIAMKDHKFHLGVAAIEADGKDVTILEVTPLTSDNVEFLGAVTNYGTTVATQGGPGAGSWAFPPEYMRSVHPIGQLIPASATAYVPTGWEKPAPIIVSAGFRLTSGDSGGVNGIRLVYQIGNEKRTEVARIAAVACEKSCEKAAKRDSDHYEDVLRSHGLLPAEDD